MQSEENEILSAPFTEKEVFEAIAQMKPNKAPGPDGFPAEFYKKCWHIVKDYLMSMFHVFFQWTSTTVSFKFQHDYSFA